MVEVLENSEEVEEEKEDSRRFVGRMAVSFRGGGGAEDGDAAITLHNFNQKKHRERREEGPTDQSGKSFVAVRRNGFRAPAALHRWVLRLFRFLFFFFFEVCS